jgi:hypothetical protein
VLSYAGVVPWMAKMHSPLDWQRLFLYGRQNPSPDEVAHYLRSANIDLVYLDHMLLKNTPALYSAIRDRIGHDYLEVYRTDPEGVAYRVYRLRPAG